jgi:hypothetical protein
MYFVVGAVLGYVLGLAFRHSIFSAKGGASAVLSLVLASLIWLAAVLAFSIYAEIELGAKRQPAWVGLSAFFAAASFFFGVRK